MKKTSNKKTFGHARHWSRRSFLQMATAAGAGLAGFGGLQGKLHAQTTGQPADRLLFVFTATGGGSITDSFLAARKSDITLAGQNSDDFFCYDNGNVHAAHGAGGGDPFADPTTFRAVDLPAEARISNLGTIGTMYSPKNFIDDHGEDTAVMTVEGTSVNHFVAQTRSLNGAGINNGRTLGEAVAEVYGQHLPLPYINMGSGGYLENGVDASLPSFARGEPVVAPEFFGATTDAVRGMVGAMGSTPTLQSNAPLTSQEIERAYTLMQRTRNIRGQAEAQSIFGQTYTCVDSARQFKDKRQYAINEIETKDLISNLLFLNEIGIDLSQFGLQNSPFAQVALDAVQTMPNYNAPMCDPNDACAYPLACNTSTNMCEAPDSNVGLSTSFFDPFHAQIILSFLAARSGYGCAFTLGPSLGTDLNVIGVNPPLSFDFSHNQHIQGQAHMWSRVLDGVNKLIRLLKTVPTDDGTLWDRSLVFIASDFGRDKLRPQTGAGDYGTGSGHHLNNGNVIVSPLINGGRVYGGIDYSNLLTHGFDPMTGDATPGSLMTEGDVYSVVCDALGVNFPGQTHIPCMLPG